ncbi:MAG: tetratricopeptide repeat protein [Rhodocyclaceae bacterium]
MKHLVGVFAACGLVCLPAASAAGNDAARIEAAQALHARGQGQQAIAKLLPLAREGNAEAAYLLGRLYYYDEAGVPRDWRMAARWFERAARAGHAGGQYKLGGIYYTGRGRRQDVEQAIYWWAKAAVQGHPEALNNLGALVSTGTGMTADPELGLALQHLAAEQGSEAAQENVRNKPPSERSEQLAREFSAHPSSLAERIAKLVEKK